MEKGAILTPCRWVQWVQRFLTILRAPFHTIAPAVQSPIDAIALAIQPPVDTIPSAV
jgi:hypothetical protein